MAEEQKDYTGPAKGDSEDPRNPPNSMLAPEGQVGYGWQTQDLQPWGACGNAAAADAERGRTEVERAAAALVRLCGEVAAYPLAKITGKTAYGGG